MRRAITLLIFAAMMFPASQAQQNVETDGRVTYFLIDASGSMAKDGKGEEAESKVLEKLAEIRALDPDAPVSRTYFRAENRDLCWHAVAISDPIPASESVRQFPKYGDDYTPLGGALEAAILDVGDGRADIFILSDEVQSPNCGNDICEVARRYFPSERIRVESIPIGPEAKSRFRLACVQEAQANKITRVDSEHRSDGANRDLRKKGREVNWENEGWWERWLWLLVFVLGVGSAVSFAMRHGSKALAYESRSQDIQGRQRLLLTGEGDADEHKVAISNLSEFAEPKKNGWLVFGVALLICAICAGGVLLFCDGSCFGVRLDDDDTFLCVKLDAARKLAWLVLSSDFSNAFAILGITPIIFSFAQNWRYIQAKRTFAVVSGIAAEEESRRQSQELDDLFDELKELRASITRSTISTPWADVPKTQYRSNRRRSAEFNEEDLANLGTVKAKLLEVAQGPIPTKVGESRSTLTESIKKLKRYAPRPWYVSNWELGELILELSREELFGDNDGDWLSLARSISRRDVSQIKSILKRIANFTLET